MQQKDKWRSPTRCWCVIVAALMLAGCAASIERAESIAARAALVRRGVDGVGFRHVVYESAAVAAAGPLWIYIEGDGAPWLNEFVPARDPTPRVPVALAMLVRGPRPAAYVGRPCYFEANADPGCEPMIWTHARFGPDVVRSMQSAIEALLAAHRTPARPLVLVGFSGGGTLATLLAARVPNACALVTVASPLDLGEWAREREYSRLADSLDPAREPALPQRIGQLHLRGRHDAVVGFANGAAFLQRNPRARLQILDRPRHGVEWVDEWARLSGERGALPLSSCLSP
jgi:predicted esterase